jgi:hypothetical protein
MMLNVRNPDSGGGLPGGTSDTDLGFLGKIPVTITQSREGREFVAETNDKINDRKLEIQRKLLQHEMNGGKFDSAFQKSIADWAKENPLFGEEVQKKLDKIMAGPTAPAAPKGKQAAPTGPPPALGATWDEQRGGWVIKSGNKIYDWK